MNRSSNQLKILTSALVAAALLTGLLFTRLYSYLLFHSLAELFSIVIACTIFVLAWNTQRFVDNGFLLFIGIALLFVSGIDLLHTFAYKGMGIFAVGEDPNLATQLWIAARYLQSISFLIAPFFLRRKFKTSPVIAGYSVVLVLLLLSIFVWDIFPDCFVLGSGLTPFKRISEGFIILLFGGSLAMFFNSREEFDPGVLEFLSLSITATIVQEMAFSIYTDVYGLANLAGHLLKIIAYYFMYKAIVETGLNRPYQLLFRNLNIYAGQLKERNQELLDFSSVASHDLKEPLRKVQAFGERLKSQYGQALGDEGLDYIERMQAATSRMQQMVEDLLTYSRVTTHYQPLMPVDLSTVLNEVLSDLEISIERTGGRVEADALPTIEADPVQMRELLQNLIGNGLKFHQPGTPPEVRVYVREHPDESVDGVGRVRTSLGAGLIFTPTPSSSQIQLIFEDNGIGFKEESLGEIFMPFHRLHGRSEYEGSGMGLAICRKIVERHGGSITAHSTPGKGSRFIVTLPKKH